MLQSGFLSFFPGVDEAYWNIWELFLFWGCSVCLTGFNWISFHFFCLQRELQV